MKKNVVKTMVAAVCIAAAGMGGMKAYNAGNLCETSMLLAENVEALSDPEILFNVCYHAPNQRCYFDRHDGWLYFYRDQKGMW